MREAVGSTFLFQIMIVFIFFFTAFLAIAINYAQAFQTKNKVISALEQSEGYNSTSKAKIESIAKDSGYFRGLNDAKCQAKLGDNSDNTFVAKNTDGQDIPGICIKYNKSSNGDSAYYTVSTFIWFDFPLIGDIATIPVKGETKLIINNNYEN